MKNKLKRIKKLKSKKVATANNENALFSFFYKNKNSKKQTRISTIVF